MTTPMNNNDVTTVAAYEHAEVMATASRHILSEGETAVLPTSSSTAKVVIDCRESSTIGITLTKRRQNIQVHNFPKRQSLAYTAGVRRNDVILAIEYGGATLRELEEMRTALVHAAQSRSALILLLQRSSTVDGNDGSRQSEPIDQTDRVEHGDTVSVGNEMGDVSYEDMPGPSTETFQESRKRRQPRLQTPDYVHRERDRRRVANMTQEHIDTQRVRHRIANMTQEHVDAQRARHQVINMTPEHIDAQRAHHQVINMTPEHIDAQRATHRVVNMTPEQIDAQRNRAVIVRRRRPLLNCARGEMADAGTDRHVLSRMTIMCPDCTAKHWLEEKATSSSVRQPKFSMCCAFGRVSLPALNQVPPPLHRLLTDDAADCIQFRSRIRAYNSVLAFTSVGVKLDEYLASDRQGAFTYRIQGELVHRMGTLRAPGDGERPHYAQMYIYDTDHEVENRMHVMPNLDAATLRILQSMLHECNPYVRVFRQAIDVIRNNPASEVQLLIRSDTHGVDRRRYNAPTAPDVAAIMIGDGSEATAEGRDIIVSTIAGPLRRVYETQPAYDPLHYVLLFPRGENGWNMTLSAAGRRKVTLMDFSAYRLQIRDGCIIPYSAGRLLHQYAVDCYARIEQQRLLYLRTNQAEFRAEMYQGVFDAALAGETNANNIGRRIILPSSFIGGPRHMQQLFQDAMSIVREFGKPDLFVTFTCNPKWEEITNELMPHQTAADRPDLLARVFKLKLKELTNDLFSNGVLGRTVAHIHVIEFQKRGLPHAHILIILAQEDKLRTPDDYDAIVSAEIPNPLLHLEAHETVVTSMIHGPCGSGYPNSPCIGDDGLCTKRYPRAFAQATTDDEDGYPTYRRRNDGRTCIVRRGGIDFEVDNRWVVPHNLYLCKKYNAHINVEICSSIKAVKYLYKYVYKGHDRVMIELNRESNRVAAVAGAVDEVQRYLDARYVSAPEAIWRIFGFSLHNESPHPERLEVHLPNEQMAYMRQTDNVAVVAQGGPRRTTLTEWFRFNAQHADARVHLYHQFPKHYAWNNTAKVWTARASLATGAIGRMYTVAPTEGERFYLRLLLHHVAGATSYEDVRTVNGQVFPSFRDAAREMGLLQDDAEWNACLVEASHCHSARIMRHMFATILLHCQPADPQRLFNTHSDALCEDMLHVARQHNRVAHVTDEMVNDALLDIQDVLEQQGKTLRDFPNMPIPVAGVHALHGDEPKEVREELAYDDAMMHEYVRVNNVKMNANQRAAYDAILTAVHNDNVIDRLFFLDAPGGTGKTFLLNMLLDTCRSQHQIALAVASSGVAALLLHGGRTAHSRFKIPVFQVNEASTCSISAQSGTAALIRRAHIIVWDEAPMMNKDQLACVERSIRDLMSQTGHPLAHLPFGGKIVVFAGDFRQVLPVVRRGERAKIVSMTMKRWSLWPSIRQLSLTQNMRIMNLQGHSADEQAAFATYLMSIGDGRERTYTHNLVDDYVQLRGDLCVKSNNVDELIAAVFVNFDNVQAFTGRAILTPKNVDVDRINDSVMRMFPGEEYTYLSADTVADQQAATCPTEFLNTLNPSGIPPHALTLKVNCPIILLRNLNPASGLCNGTRLICRQMHQHLIDAEIITGTHAGERVFIHRVTLTPSDTGLPFDLQRRQFPIRPCFAMTINKAQSQTMDFVGLYLPNHVFTHGQLYVALSRVGAAKNTKVLVTNGKLPGEVGTYTRNVVYREVL